MSKKFLGKMLSVLLSVVMLTACFSACGSSSGDVKFWVYGSNQETSMYKAMAEKFNNTYGAAHDVHVTISTKPVSGYTTVVETSSTSSKSCPDVFLVVDDNFRAWIGKSVIADMDSYINDPSLSDLDISDIYPTSLNRLRYTKGTKKITSSGDIYGLPVSSRPLALYYNETMFKNAGIVIISVDEEDMDAFNAGTKADRNGKTLADYKEEYPVLANLGNNEIPAKGFFRSKKPYTGTSAWTKATSTEVMIFNNRIPMNWDELEDLAMLFTPKDGTNPDGYNDKAGDYFKDSKGTPTLKRGFFTEWWFSYCWSVGGDCLQDLTGNGDWDYALLDASDNYMVMKDGFGGAYTGTVYKAGETVQFLDKFNVPAGEKMTPDNNGGYTYKGSAVGTAANIAAAVADGTLIILPSTRAAFNRYLKLGSSKDAVIEGEGGLDIALKPLELLSKKAENYFYSCNIAMLINYSSYMSITSEQAEKMGFIYDVAPIPVYKEYNDPFDPYDDTVKVAGKPAGQSSTFSMVSCPNSTHKKEAAAFIKWMASKEGQAICAEHGFFPNQAELVKDIKFTGSAPKNVQTFVDGLSYQSPGDWMYMPDYGWINVWAVPLNSYVRNGLKLDSDKKDNNSYNEWKSIYVGKTNQYLKDNYR